MSLLTPLRGRGSGNFRWVVPKLGELSYEIDPVDVPGKKAPRNKLIVSDFPRRRVRSSVIVSIICGRRIRIEAPKNRTSVTREALDSISRALKTPEALPTKMDRLFFGGSYSGCFHRKNRSILLPLSGNDRLGTRLRSTAVPLGSCRCSRSGLLGGLCEPGRFLLIVAENAKGDFPLFGGRFRSFHRTSRFHGKSRGPTASWVPSSLKRGIT